jgi:hypothetical protein
MLGWVWDSVVAFFSNKLFSSDAFEDGDSILLVGPRKSGKTTFFNRLTEVYDDFIYVPTQMTDSSSFEIPLDDEGGVLAVNLVDISGTKVQRPKQLQELVKNATVLIFCVSARGLLRDDNYFEDATTWAGVVGKWIEDDTKVGYVFTHEDQLEDIGVTTEEFFDHDRLKRFGRKVGLDIDQDEYSLLVDLRVCPLEDLVEFVTKVTFQ